MNYDGKFYAPIRGNIETVTISEVTDDFNSCGKPNVFAAIEDISIFGYGEEHIQICSCQLRPAKGRKPKQIKDCGI